MRHDEACQVKDPELGLKDGGAGSNTMDVNAVKQRHAVKYAYDASHEM